MSFGAHQSFHIRDGWLFKGMSAIRGDQELGVTPDPTIFTHQDAPQLLGIGRNMVRALRFWMQASGLTQEFTNSTGRREHKFTDFGNLVWRHDAYLEDLGTLWLIHYHLVSHLHLSTTWYWFFNHFGQDKFSQQYFFEQLRHWTITTETERETVTVNVLEKEFSTFINTYRKSNGKQSPENLLICPLTELGLLADEESNMYRLLPMSSERVHPLIFLYVLLQKSPNKLREETQINLSQILTEPMSVGRVFNLGASGVIELLSRLRNDYSQYGIEFIRTSGLDIIRLPQINTTLTNVLSCYYEESS